jgi:hypothetical protein
MSMKPKCTIIASFSNPQRVMEEVNRIQETYDVEIVLPTQEWFDRMKNTMGKANACSGKITDDKILAMKGINMETYFKAIHESDIIHIFNVKAVHDDRFAKDISMYIEKEYYGINTLIEIGIAHCLGKKITCYKEPTEPEIKNLIWRVI